MTMIFILVAAATQATAPVSAPSAEAEQLGVRLAQTATLATNTPLLIAEDIEEVLTQHPELNDAEKMAFRATAKRVESERLARIYSAFGRAYASRLSVADLRALVAHAESPAAARWREIMPTALMAAVSAAGDVDFKREAVSAYCRETGKLCKTPIR